jgi:hypothetical protein
MRLGQLIDLLERLPPSLPVGLGEAHSFRGYYDQLSFEPDPAKTAGEALTEARLALGRIFTGYKGGEYTMEADTMCWVSKYGSSSDVTAGEHMALLLARWLEERSYT